MTTKKNIHRFPCIIVKQGKHELVCFVAPAKTIYSFVDINRRDPDKKEGYQRVLSRSRVEVLANYIDRGNPIPNSVLISLNQGITFSSDRSFIEIPSIENAGWVIDGQHRLAASSESSANPDLVVVAFIGLEIKEQVRQFVVINREAVGVPTSLYLDLLKDLPHIKTDNEQAQERATDIAHELRKQEDSPFYDRITVITSPKRGEQLSLTNFVRKVSSLVNPKSGKFGQYSYLEQKKILDNFYRALENVFPDEFERDRATFFKTLGFGAMMNALQIVFDITIKHYSGFTVEDVTKTIKSVQDFNFAGWDVYGSGSKAEIQAGNDFTASLKTRLSSETATEGVLRL